MNFECDTGQFSRYDSVLLFSVFQDFTILRKYLFHGYHKATFIDEFMTFTHPVMLS